MEEIKLETKLVGNIAGKFIVPSYQRGYRWGKDEVERLLDDIYENKANNYCLQPIVVKKNGDLYELVDGQQRLTTLYLIYKYMHDTSSGFLDEPRFSLTYQTREDDEDFLLSTIDITRKEENINFWFICSAYETIGSWFDNNDKKSALTNINKYFDENVQVIWYEVDGNQDSIALFTRLNIGKIPLTSAELVKAMFLCRGNEELVSLNSKTIKTQLDREKREEISLQWDSIEKDLHNENLWYFLTNNNNQSYQTRIDLVLDLMAKRPIGNKNKYYAFFEFDQKRKEKDLDELWKSILNTFLILKDWFENHELYHKIGYLIASDKAKAYLNELYGLSEGKNKSKFLKELDDLIRKSVDIKSNYGELSYDKDGDCGNISKLLLLFNVESVRRNGESTQWFPFDKFKFEKGKKVLWSLEHIHAQQSKGMGTKDAWKEWLKLHKVSIESLDGDHSELKKSIVEAINNDRLDREEFEKLQQKIIVLLSEKGSTEYLHSISNLALLNTSDNAALNNSTFDVKRNAVIKMDKAGKYIPFCTKMVFFKYYTPSAGNQLHFWGMADRRAYIKAINECLSDYLAEEIVIE